MKALAWYSEIWDTHTSWRSDKNVHHCSCTKDEHVFSQKWNEFKCLPSTFTTTAPSHRRFIIVALLLLLSMVFFSHLKAKLKVCHTAGGNCACRFCNTQDSQWPNFLSEQPMRPRLSLPLISDVNSLRVLSSLEPNWQHHSFSFRDSGHPSIRRQETLPGQSWARLFLMHDRPRCFTWPWKHKGGWGPGVGGHPHKKERKWI